MADDDDDSLDVGACCLCHCALDYSDKAAFHRASRYEDYTDDDYDSYYFRPSDPFLPSILEDANNACLYCDSCPRLFHQHCHFEPVLTFNASKPWQCLLCQTKQQPDKLFQSPPIQSVRDKEQQWEHDATVIAAKKTRLKTELQKLSRSLSNSISVYKRAAENLETLTSSHRNRKHFNTQSQELIQCVTAFVSSKYKIRTLLCNLENIRQSKVPRQRWQTLQKFCDTVDKDFEQRVLFPFGRQHPRRWPAVTPEFRLDTINGVPSVIVLEQQQQQHQQRSTRSPKRKPHHKPAKKEDDASFALDELECCVCLNGDSTDDNDMVLCDGQGCFRAYHMHCVQPAIQADEDVDWFCPLCQFMAEALANVQGTLNGDDWEHRRLDEPHDGSLASWDNCDDVFPEAEIEYEVLQELKNGVRSHKTEQLLARILGIEREIDDDDNIDEDGHFDLHSYEEERRLERDNEGDSDSHSSQVTLQELSSVELEIDDDEIAALQQEYEQNEIVVTRRRLRSKGLRESSNENESDDPGKMDPKNIVLGKRKRLAVDYRKLNDIIFGDTAISELDKMDGGADFVIKPRSDESSCSDSSES